MRFATLIFLPILVLSLAGDALGQTSGMFGPRTLGSPIRPGASQFDDGLQRGPSGTFLGTGRPAGQNMFTTPWQQPFEAPVYLPFAYGMLPNGQLAAIPPNMITPGGAILPVAPPQETAAPFEATGQPEGPLPPEGSAGYGVPVPPAAMPASPAALPSSGTPGSNNVPPPPAAPSTGVTPVSTGGATPLAVDYTALLGWNEQSSASAPGVVIPAGTQLDSVYLPDLSDRLTQTARDHGMQVYAPIRVSAASGTAIVRGVVGTAHDRLLIANMVLLEPGIDRINNRLIVAPAGVPAAR
jgi:hypothetical protein